MSVHGRSRRCLAAGFVLLAIFTSFARAELAQPTAVFPEKATVVLLAGLPGDIESERTYHDQLQVWLTLLEATPTKLERAVVFCDNFEGLKLPVKFPCQVLKAGREEFLGLGKTLAGTTNPVVVIVWGHGGMQGKTPVFHVRGPRLTAEDFKAFARQAAPAESHWILFFRGSGSFASLLAAEGRQIISSEKETAFTSDPIGMALVLKALRADPSISFEALGEELGRATTAWYAERNLARTEDPTLWFGTRKARLLAGENAQTAPPEAVANVKPAESADDKSTNTTVPPAGLPPIWKQIGRVKPDKYPEAEGIVLRRRVSYTLGRSPAITSEHEEFVQILEPGGKRLGDFDFSYSPPQQNLTFLDCEVLQPNGKLVRLDPDEIRDAGEESMGDYPRPRRKFFSLPGVSPGAVLHVRYLSEWKSYPLPHVTLEIPLTGELPALESSLQITVPKDSPFHFLVKQISAGDPGIKQTTYGSTYTWQFENLPAEGKEPLAPPHAQAALLVSTFPDWREFA